MCQSKHIQSLLTFGKKIIAPCIKTWKENQTCLFLMAQSIPSIHMPPPPPRHLPDIGHFVLEKLQMPHGGAGRSYNNCTVGLKNRVQIPHSGTTPKLYFPVNKLQIPYLWEISYNLLIKRREAPYANHP